MARHFKRVHAVACAAVATAVLAAGSAQAATIIDGFQFDQGVSLDISGVSPCSNTGGTYQTNVGRYDGAGVPGSGKASCGDRTTAQVKTDTTPNPYGRFSPTGDRWIDSNDLGSITWHIDSLVPLQGVSFAMTDAHDQKNSFFSISVDGATWTIPDRLPNGNLQLIAILFDAPTTQASILFETRVNDGYGVSNVRLAPVPLPPALALLGAGAAAIGLIGRRRRRAI